MLQADREGGREGERERERSREMLRKEAEMVGTGQRLRKHRKAIVKIKIGSAISVERRKGQKEARCTLHKPRDEVYTEQTVLWSILDS